MQNWTPKHSILIFMADTREDILDQVMGYIKNGIKVDVFAMDTLEAKEADSEWIDAKKLQLLNWWEIPFKTEYRDQIVGTSGNSLF